MRLRICGITLPERIVGVLQLGVPRDPILCRALGGEAPGGPDHSTHLTKHNAKTPVALNEHLVCCFGHWSNMVPHHVRPILANNAAASLGSLRRGARLPIHAEKEARFCSQRGVTFAGSNARKAGRCGPAFPSGLTGSQLSGTTLAVVALGAALGIEAVVGGVGWRDQRCGSKHDA